MRAAPARSRASARQASSVELRAGNHEHVVEAVQKRLDENPDAMRTRRRDGRASVRHTEDADRRATHFLCVTLPKVATEMALDVLSYNFTRVMNIGRREAADCGNPGLRCEHRRARRGLARSAQDRSGLTPGCAPAKICSNYRVKADHARSRTDSGKEKRFSHGLDPLLPKLQKRHAA